MRKLGDKLAKILPSKNSKINQKFEKSSMKMLVNITNVLEKFLKKMKENL